jgi:polyhydroxyalkanoate synthase subunit PhaC
MKSSDLLQHDLDRVVHATVAQATGGFSPLSALTAYMDWLTHLAFSPGKQQELALKALDKGMQITSYAMRVASGRECKDCIEPLPQDKRFAALEWHQWPYNVVYQAFLLNQQWWHDATKHVRGVEKGHERMVNFAARQALDFFSPSNFVATNPEVLAETWKTAGQNLFNGMQNWLQDAMRLATNQPPLGVEQFTPGQQVAITPGKVVFRNHLIELIQYSPATEKVHSEPILIVPAWIMKYYILDLSPENSMVKFLVESGHTVFMVSWRNPTADDREISMDDYLKDGVLAAFDAISGIIPGQRVQALGYCLGGTLLSIACSYMARNHDERLHTLTLLASQLDFDEPGELALFIDESQLAFLDDIMSAQGFLDGKQMLGAFALLNQRDLVFSRMVHDYLMGKRRSVSDLSAWNADATRMPFHQHSHYLHSLYLNNDFAQGRYHVEGKPVVVKDVRVPIFCLGTERDTISPWRSVYKIHLLTDAEITFCLTSGGHNVGVVNPPGDSEVTRGYRLAKREPGARYIDPETWVEQAESFQGSWWPAWEAWLKKTSGGLVDPPPMGNPTIAGAVFEDAPGRYVQIP